MDKYCLNVCHGGDLWSCMNNPRLQESDSEESDDTTVRFDFKVPMQRNFTQRFLDCIAKII